MNGSFDQEPKNPVAWIEGATEPRKALAISLDGEQKAHGTLEKLPLTHATKSVSKRTLNSFGVITISSGHIEDCDSEPNCERQPCKPVSPREA